MLMQPTVASSTHAALVRKARATGALRPLLAVLRWELRRTLISPATWILAAMLIVVSVVFLLLSRQQENFGQSYPAPTGYVTHSVTGAIPWTTPFGMAVLLPFPALFFGLFLPFATTDGAARDLRRRTHELLMTTPVPTWAYVWGRYLACALLCLGLAVLFLAGIVLTGLVQHGVQPDTYPALDLPATLAIWALIVLPPAILLSGLSFALGTLLPQRTNIVKVGIVFCWFVGGNFLPAYMLDRASRSPGFSPDHLPAWYTAYLAWDPSFVGSGNVHVMGQFQGIISSIVRNYALSEQDVLQQVCQVELRMPDLSSFVAPHLVWAAVGLVCVVVAALIFRRFRNVTG
jgi:ABC-type transport system involved in multi-copper enzyme maturation permease subunit